SLHVSPQVRTAVGGAHTPGGPATRRTRMRWLLLPAVVLVGAGGVRAYVEAPHTLGRCCKESTNVVLVEVTKVNKEKGLIIYKKLRDLKGKQPDGEIKHNIGQRGFHAREWQNVMAWAAVGKKAVFFHNGGGQEALFFPQGGGKGDLHRPLRVSVLPRGRLVGHEPRRAVPDAHLLRRPRKARRCRRSHREGRGGCRPLPRRWQQGTAPPAQ